MGELKRLLRLAWPVIIGQVGFMAMSVEDLVMVGRLGELELAGLAAGNIWAFGTLIPCIGLMLGLDPVFAQAHGSGQPKAAGRALARSLLLAVVVGLPVMALHFWAEDGLRLLGQPEEVLPIAGAYCRALSWSVIPSVLFWALKQYTQGLELMRPAAIVIVVANVLNIALNEVFIFGHFGFPELGAVGSGHASTLVRVVMPIALAALVWKDITARWASWREAFEWRPLLALLWRGGPVGVHTTLEVWAFNCIGVFMGWIGATELAAHSVALNMTAVAFCVAWGLSAAAATRVGNLLGAGEPWQKTGWIAIGLSLGVMGTSAVVFLSVPGLLAAAYTPDVDVQAIVLVLLPLAAAFQLFDGVQAVAGGVLRGAGDTRFPAVLALVGFWIVGVPLAAGLAFGLDLGARGLWMGLDAMLIAVSILLAGRVVLVGRRGGYRVV